MSAWPEIWKARLWLLLLHPRLQLRAAGRTEPS